MNKSELIELIKEVNEGAMSALDIIAQEASDWKDFVKQAMKEFPELKKDKKGATLWLKKMYANPMNEGKLNESKSDKVFVDDDQLWFAYSPGSGNTQPVDYKKPLTNHPEMKNSEYSMKLFIEWASGQKPVKTVKKEFSVSKVYKIPVYMASRNYTPYENQMGRSGQARFDVFKDQFSDQSKQNYIKPADIVKPKSHIYILHVKEGKYDWIHFFKTKNQATGWIGESIIKEAKISSTLNSLPTGEKGYKFVVSNRDTKGMKGTQDKFQMSIVDDGGNVVLNLGSHPSKTGAVKFYQSKKIGGMTVAQLKKTFSYMTETSGTSGQMTLEPLDTDRENEKKARDAAMKDKDNPEYEKEMSKHNPAVQFNEGAIIYGIEYKQSPGEKFRKASMTISTHRPEADKDMMKAITKNAKKLKKQEKWSDFRIVKNGQPVNEGAEEPQVIKDLRWIVDNSQNKKVKDPKSGKQVRVDLYSASAVVQVYDALKKPENQKKFVESGLAVMVHMAFKLLKENKLNEDVALPNCNLYLLGGGKDTNGNSIVKIGYPNARGFSIQSNGTLPKTYDILRGLKSKKDMGKVSDADLKKISKEVCDYVKNHGSGAQKGKLKVYEGSNKILKHLKKYLKLQKMNEEVTKGFKPNHYCLAIYRTDKGAKVTGNWQQDKAYFDAEVKKYTIKLRYIHTDTAQIEKKVVDDYARDNNLKIGQVLDALM